MQEARLYLEWLQRRKQWCRQFKSCKSKRVAFGFFFSSPNRSYPQLWRTSGSWRQNIGSFVPSKSKRTVWPTSKTNLWAYLPLCSWLCAVGTCEYAASTKMFSDKHITSHFTKKSCCTDIPRQMAGVMAIMKTKIKPKSLGRRLRNPSIFISTKPTFSKSGSWSPIMITLHLNCIQSLQWGGGVYLQPSASLTCDVKLGTKLSLSPIARVKEIKLGWLTYYV